MRPLRLHQAVAAYSWRSTASKPPVSTPSVVPSALEGAVVRDVGQERAVARDDAQVPGAVAVVEEGDSRAVRRVARAVDGLAGNVLEEHVRLGSFRSQLGDGSVAARLAPEED